ncbi:MAG: hypothetical protein LBG48_00480 [Rickettsiales bacterium]|jgi:hypothetical protein|nr:hypothetical protein [Rickettsiales bacterium]
MNSKALCLLERVNKILKTLAITLVGVLVLQILSSYLGHSNNEHSEGDDNQLNIIKNSYIQVNTKDNNLYIKSDLIELFENEIVLRTNFIDSNTTYGTSDLIIYNKTTGDISLKNRPKLTLMEF